MVHCLFEQSGTFKNAFKKLGYNAIDYDIVNKFGQTDVKIDLFAEIDKCKQKQKSIFDGIKKEDLIIAFFPCTYFSTQNNLIFAGKTYCFKNWSEERINKYIADRLIMRDKFFTWFVKLIDIIYDRDLHMIIENPYHDNYLLKAFWRQPDLVIKDRTAYGDDLKKPTMFYAFNYIMKDNDVEMICSQKEIRLIQNVSKGIKRSLIKPEFADNFIKKHILNGGAII